MQNANPNSSSNNSSYSMIRIRLGNHHPSRSSQKIPEGRKIINSSKSKRKRRRTPRIFQHSSQLPRLPRFQPLDPRFSPRRRGTPLLLFLPHFRLQSTKTPTTPCSTKAFPHGRQLQMMGLRPRRPLLASAIHNLISPCRHRLYLRILDTGILYRRDRPLFRTRCRIPTSLLPRRSTLVPVRRPSLRFLRGN